MIRMPAAVQSELPWLPCPAISALPAAALKFQSAAAWARLIPAHLRRSAHRGRFGIERQSKIVKHCLGPVVDAAFAHPGLFAHQVHRQEIVLQKAQDLQRIAGHRDLFPPVHLHRADLRQAAHHHRPHRVHVKIAKVQPVRPSLMKRGVEPPDFRNHVDFARVLVPALDAEHEAIHQVAQGAPSRQLVQSVQAEEVAEIATFDLVPAEFIENQTAAHGRIVIGTRSP